MVDYESDSSVSFHQSPFSSSSSPIHYNDEDEEFLNDFSDLNDVDYERQCMEAERQFDNEAPVNNEQPSSYKRTKLSDADRKLAYSMLLRQSINDKVSSRVKKEVAQIFKVSPRSIYRLWRLGKKSGNHNVSLSRVGNCGRKRVLVDVEKVKDIPLVKITALRCLSHALGVSTTRLFKTLERKELIRHSNYVHPMLTEDNKFRRIEHCLSMIDPTTVATNPTFLPMENVIHIDEKWFSMRKKIQSYYLAASEEAPVRTCKSTNFIPKIMFFAAVARPRYDSEGKCTFDGKLGVFAMVHEVPAKRSSLNRVARTMELKAIPKINRDVIRTFMISKLLPAIKEKWPRDCITKPILIQQDNARAHIRADDVDFLLAVRNSGLNVSIFCQPPNSPDLNVLDLGFFRAIQSLQQKVCAKSVVQLIAVVERSFYEFSSKKSNHIFITLQSCMIQILSTFGSNTYKIPHLQKNQLERRGILPSRLSCNSVIIDAAIAHLSPE